MRKGNNAKKNNNTTIFVDTLAGVGASLVALWLFYPLDVIKTNLQAGTNNSNNQAQEKDDAKALFSCNKREESLFLFINHVKSRWYRGIAIKSLHTMASSFAYFYIYAWIFALYNNKNNQRQRQSPLRVSTLTRLSLSAIAAMLNVCCTLPLDVIASQMQTRNHNEKEKNYEETHSQRIINSCQENGTNTSINNDEQENNTTSNVEKMSQKIASLWKGFLPSILLCCNPSIHFTIFESIKSHFIQQQEKQQLSIMQSFFAGLVSKLVATLATFPLIRAKVMLMCLTDGNKNNDEKEQESTTVAKTMMGCLIQEYKRGGIQCLYQGCNVQLVHTVLKSALMMMLREQMTLTMRRLLLGAKNKPNKQSR